MMTPEVVFMGEADPGHLERDQDIADDAHHRGRRRGRHFERAYFLWRAGKQDDVGKPGEARAFFSGHTDDGKISNEAFAERNQFQYLPCLAGIRNQEQHVIRLKDADVAVNRFERMQEDRGRAGG